MKKLLIALAVSTVALSGCGLFTTQHAWKQAKQENPLQIPPNLNKPSTSAALTIPPPSSTQAATTPSAQPAANSTRMHLSDDVDAAFKRVGLALQRGDLGTVVAQDPAQHTYEISIGSKAQLGQSQSFLQKHFSNIKQSQSSDSSGAAGSAQDAGKSTVTLTVAPAKGGGSTVSAQGDTQQSLHVISVLRGRLGG